MKLTRTVHFNLAWLGVMPLATVLFLVLAFFSLGFKFAVQPGIQVTAPLSAFALKPQRNPVIVTISGAPVPQMFFEQEKIPADQLPARLGRLAGRDRTLIIKADKTTPYDMVVTATNEGLRRGFPVVLATGEERK
jgi:biopolymer transport protein ExbD